MATLSGLFLILLAGFIAQRFVYSRSFSLRQQVASRFPLGALLVGILIAALVRMGEMAVPVLAQAGSALANFCSGLLGSDSLQRVSPTLYLSVALSPLFGALWMVCDYLLAYWRIKDSFAARDVVDGVAPGGRGKSWWPRCVEFHRYAKLQIASDSAGLIHGVLVRALREGCGVTLTLRSGKVYIGMVVDLGQPEKLHLADAALRLVPVQSGFRDDERKVVITTDYALALDRMAQLRESASGAERDALDADIRAIGQHFRISDIETASFHRVTVAGVFAAFGTPSGPSVTERKAQESGSSSGAGSQMPSATQAPSETKLTAVQWLLSQRSAATSGKLQIDGTLAEQRNW